MNVDASLIRVLLIEDDEDDYLITRRILGQIERARYQLDWLRTVDAALCVAKSGAVDVVLCDYHLDQETGLDFLDQVQKCAPDLPVILLTGEKSLTVDLRVMAAGAMEFLSKGQLVPDLLERSIRYAIERKARERTDRQRAALEQTILREQFQQAQKWEVIGALAGGVTHDLGNVLNLMMAVADQVLSEIGYEHPAAPLFDQLFGAGQRGREIIGRLMSFSRRDEGGAGGRCQPALVAGEAVSLLKVSKPKSVELVFEVQGPYPEIGISGAEFFQVVLNLGLNALQAMSDGGLLSIGVAPGDKAEAAQSLIVGNMPPNDCICLTVADTGCGMAPEDVRRIFEPFFTTKKKGEGTGLGLAAVNGIVTAAGGAIAVDSQRGRGTTFRVFLPLA